MHTVNSATANWDILTGKRAESKNDSPQSVFSASLRAMLESQTSIQDAFDRLAGRFPNADVSRGKPNAGAQGTRDYFGSEEGDKVAVDESLLAAMSGDNGLAQKVEDAIAGFFNSDAGANAAVGVHTQRSASITITAVRFTVSQFDAESGELMSAQEMLTSLREKMDELVGRIFGKDGESAAGGSKKSGKDYGNRGGDAFDRQSFSFSMELFYSNRLLNGMAGSGQGRNSQFSVAGLAMGGSFQNFSGSALPSAIYDALANSDDFPGPFTSLLDGGLGNFGMKSSGFQYSAGGFSLKADSSGDLLAGLLDLLMNNAKRPEAPGKPADLAEPETPGTTGAPAEVAAV